MKLMAKKLPIVIGAFEAQSIAIALEKEIKPPSFDSRFIQEFCRTI
jgi:bifunctional DNase/RNase